MRVTRRQPSRRKIRALDGVAHHTRPFKMAPVSMSQLIEQHVDILAVRASYSTDLAKASAVLADREAYVRSFKSEHQRRSTEYCLAVQARSWSQTRVFHIKRDIEDVERRLKACQRALDEELAVEELCRMLALAS